MKRVLHAHDGNELYLDDNGKPCVRLVEAHGLIEGDGADMRRVGGAGVYVEQYVESEWRYAAGPFWMQLTGWPREAISAAKAIAS